MSDRHKAVFEICHVFTLFLLFDKGNKTVDSKNYSDLEQYIIDRGE